MKNPTKSKILILKTNFKRDLKKVVGAARSKVQKKFQGWVKIDDTGREAREWVIYEDLVVFSVVAAYRAMAGLKPMTLRSIANTWGTPEKLTRIELARYADLALKS